MKRVLTRPQRPHQSPSYEPVVKGSINLISIRFPFNNFTYCLTLFSKFFSSFPHGTCSLSVSRQYLALDGIYHPFSAAFPNNTTRRERITKALVICAKDGIVTLYDVLFQETYAQASADSTSLNYNSDSCKNCQI